MHKDLNDSDFSRVNGYFLNAANSYLCTRASRFVVFGTETESGYRQPNRIFLYISSHGERSSHEEYWIELNQDREHLDFLADLENAIDPIQYYPKPVWDSWKLPDFVRTHYQISFGKEGDTYGKVRDILETRESAIRVAGKAHGHFSNLRFPLKFAQKSSIIRWLDIGCQTGANTGEIHKWLNNHGYTVSLTAIDTSYQNRNHLHKALRYSAFLNNQQWTFEHFCKITPRSVKFDLITCLHSWYVLDPIYLVEAYRRLSSRGIFLLTASPYGHTSDGNDPHGCCDFVNAITGAVDEVLARTHAWPKDLDRYDEKVIVEDPYRTYAEDIDAACIFFFGKDGVDFHREIHPRWIPNTILTEDGLSPAGKEITKFFLHGIGGVDEEALFTAVESRLAPLVKEEKLPACEWDFSIDRAGVSSRRRTELCFSRPSSQRANGPRLRTEPAFREPDLGATARPRRAIGRRGRDRIQELDRRVEAIERRLRAIITSALGSDVARLPPHVNQKAEERLQSAAKKRGTMNLEKYSILPHKLEFCDLRELADTITSKSLWPEFQVRFSNKETFVGKFDQISELRNGIRHSRTLDQITEKEGEAGILWFEQLLR